MVAAAVAVAVEGEQHARLDLREAVDDILAHAEVREQLDQVAPRLAQAWNATIASMMFEVGDDAVSATPVARGRRRWVRLRRSRPSPHVVLASGLSSRRAGSRSWPGAQSNIVRRVVEAAPGITCTGHRAGEDALVAGADARTSKNSQIEAQNASRSVTDQRQRSRSQLQAAGLRQPTV